MKTKRLTKQCFTAFLAVGTLLTPMFALSDELPSPPTHELNLDGVRAAFNSITNELLHLVPGADAHWTNTYYQIVVKQRADRPYKIKVARLKDTMPPREVNTTGPAPDGFCIQIRFREGKYDEPMLRLSEPNFTKPADKTKAEFYGDTVLSEFPDQNMYMVTDIQFGTEMDTNVVSHIYKLLKATITAAVKSQRSESK